MSLAHKLIEQASPPAREQFYSNLLSSLKARAKAAFSAYEKADEPGAPTFNDFVTQRTNPELIEKAKRDNAKPTRTKYVREDMRRLISAVATLEGALKFDPRIGGKPVDQEESALNIVAETTPSSIPENPEAASVTAPGPDVAYTRENVLTCIRGMVLTLRHMGEELQATTKPAALFEEQQAHYGTDSQFNLGNLCKSCGGALARAVYAQQGKADFPDYDHTTAQNRYRLTFEPALRSHAYGLLSYMSKLPPAKGREIQSIHPANEQNTSAHPRIAVSADTTRRR